MKYSYKLTYKNGCQDWSIQNYLFTEEEMLKAFKGEGVVKVKYHRHIPNGWHLCGCGNLVTHGPDNLLCDECRATYGHAFEDEL